MMTKLEAMTQVEVEAQLDALQMSLPVFRDQEAKAAAALKAAREQWEAANAALIEAAAQTKSVKEQAESNAHELTKRRFELTGEKSYKGAFEIRLTPTAEYDEVVLKQWVLGLVDKLMVLDKGAVKTFITSNEMSGYVQVMAPALVVQKPSGVIQSKKLEALPPAKPVLVGTQTAKLPDPAPAPLLEPVGEPVTLYVPTDEEQALVIASTSAAVKEILSSVSVEPTKAFDPTATSRSNYTGGLHGDVHSNSTGTVGD